MVFWNDALEFGIRAVAALGGVAVIAGAVAKFVSDHASKNWLQANKAKLDQELETHKAALSRETESHKLLLKRQELLFAREMEAADAFMAVWRKVWPQYSHPDMDWYDACCDVADRLSPIEVLLEDFLEKHSVAVSPAVREAIEQARSNAGSEKFFDNGPNSEPPKSAITAAEKVLDAIKVARDTILSDFRH